MKKNAGKGTIDCSDFLLTPGTEKEWQVCMEKKNYRLDDFFTKYRTIVIRNAYLFVQDYYSAEDICQEAFIRLEEHLDYIPPEKVRAWLLCVSERLAVDYLRKGGQYEIKVDFDEKKLDSWIQDDYDLSCLMAEKEEYEQKGKILKRLKKEKPLWYEAVCMSYLEDMDNPSIGKELGVKPSLVSKWKERAKHWLRTAYEEAYEERGS